MFDSQVQALIAVTYVSSPIFEQEWPRTMLVTAPRPSSRVAFQGERGAFSEEAAVKLLVRTSSLFPANFEALYASIQDGLADTSRARWI